MQTIADVVGSVLGAVIFAKFMGKSTAAVRHSPPTRRFVLGLGKHRFNRHPGEGRGPRPWQVIEHAAGVDAGRLSPRCRLGRYGGKFELFRVSLVLNTRTPHEPTLRPVLGFCSSVVRCR